MKKTDDYGVKLYEHAGLTIGICHHRIRIREGKASVNLFWGRGAWVVIDRKLGAQILSECRRDHQQSESVRATIAITTQPT